MRWQILKQLCNRLTESCKPTLFKGIYLKRKGNQSPYIMFLLCHVIEGDSIQQESYLFPVSQPVFDNY